MSTGWPDWIQDTNRLGELARYVSPFAVSELGLIPPDLRSFERRSEYDELAYDQVSKLYTSLRSKKIALYEPPWSPDASPVGVTPRALRIRPPAEAVRGPATHVDIALLFATMLLSTDLRAFLAVDGARLSRPLVCAYLGKPLSDEFVREPPGFTGSADRPGVYVHENGGIAMPLPIGRLTRDRGWIVVDPSLATMGPSPQVPFELASGKPLLSNLSSAGQEWYLLDIHRLAREASPYEPPRGLAVPAVFSYLPSSPDFKEYESRKEQLKELAKVTRPGCDPTVLVLQGPHGVGKSMLALRLATAADFGCGWMLNASNTGTLMTSLARAEAAERSYGDEVPDSASVRALAAEALHRLNHSEAPWAVILDNCDSPPDAPGLKPLLPRPHERGQLLIVTTTDDEWLRYAATSDWKHAVVEPLADVDLNELGIPPWVRGAAGLPLIAQILCSVDHPVAADLDTYLRDGPALAWELLLRAKPHSGVLRLARAMAWCPSDPVRLANLLVAPALRADLSDAEDLARTRLINFTNFTDSPAIQMHRLIAAAIRGQTWSDDPATAAEIGMSLVRTDAGRSLFTDASDSTALTDLESEVDEALQYLPESERGLFPHGLGVIHERRGPVSKSGAFFANAVQLLDRTTWPYESAESLIGRARVVFQDATSSSDELRTAQSNVAVARELLISLPQDVAIRQLKERGNALSLLIDRRLAREIREPDERKAKLLALLRLTWQSYEERVRIAEGLPDDVPIGQRAPRLESGLDADRAYFNLAGLYIELARDEADLQEVESHLKEAGAIYSSCRRLREERYKGRSHPHLAACIHGEAIVAFNQATWLSDGRYRLIDAIERATSALVMRKNVASAFADSEDNAVLNDGDVQKSVSLLLKASVAGILVRGRQESGSSDRAHKLVDDVLKELRSPTAGSLASRS
jgi:hypothetical protein